MLLIDVALLIPFLVALFFWARGVWSRSKGDMAASGVMFAVSLGGYAYFYRFTALSDVPWGFALICAAVAGGVALVKHRRGSSPKAAALCLVISLCLSPLLFVAEHKLALSSNALLVIAPYRSAGTWVFDDPRVGLKAEPFISGIPELIDRLVADAGIADADKGFRLIFSLQAFPGHQTRIDWRRRESGGNWYYSEKYDMEGWLCPALFKYFKRAPKEIYVKAEAVRPSKPPVQLGTASPRR